MKILSLFSGIGAFEKALTNIGIDHEVIGFSEIDKYAIKAYSAIHGIDEKLNLGDITKIYPDGLQKDIDIITHGSPCQDFSLAGKQQSGDIGSGTRSSLMWHTVKIVEAVRPKYVIWENVKNVVSKRHKHNFEKYWESMNKLGYVNNYSLLNSKDYGVPQHRERIFVISIRSDLRNRYYFRFPKRIESDIILSDLLEKEVDQKYFLNDETLKKLLSYNFESNKRIIDTNGLCSTISTMQGGHIEPKIYVKNATTKGYLEVNDGDSINLQYPNSKTRRGRVGKQVSQTLMASDNMAVFQGRVRKLTPKECWRLMGFSDDDIDKCITLGISNTQLYKLAGNSIVVNVLEEILKMLFDDDEVLQMCER